MDLSKESRIAECEKVCQDKNKTPYEKLATLCWNIWLPWYDVVHEVTGQYIECPYCETELTPKDVTKDSDICYIDIDDKNKIYFCISMPCCGEQIYITNNWQGQNTEIWEEARSRYRKIFLETDAEYQQAKNWYKIICDHIYDKEFLNGRV